MLVCPLCRIVLGSAELTCPRDGREGTQVEIEPVPSELSERFRVLEVFAAGQAGTLYLADETQTGRRGILKIIRSASHVAPDRVRLKRELHKQATLSMPNLMVPLATGEAGNIPWLFREWRDGVSLRVRLARGGALSTPEALSVIAQVTSALDELHRAGLQHRDLKPGHVLLQPQPTGVPRVWVIDAGIGQRIEAEGGFDIVGTPTYVSPEEVTGQLVSFRSDLYALGCLLYELLTGQPPYEAETTAALLRAHVERPVPEAPGQLPTGLASLLFSLLAKEPRERPFSAQQVRRALEPFLPEGGAKRDPTVGFEETSGTSARPPKGRVVGSGTLRPPPSIRPALTGMPSVPAPADLLSRAVAAAAKAEAEAEARAEAAAKVEAEAKARGDSAVTAQPAVRATPDTTTAEKKAEPKAQNEGATAVVVATDVRAEVEAAANARAEAEVTAPDAFAPSSLPRRADDTEEVDTFEEVNEPAPSTTKSPPMQASVPPQRSIPPPIPTTRSGAPSRPKDPSIPAAAPAPSAASLRPKDPSIPAAAPAPAPSAEPVIIQAGPSDRRPSLAPPDLTPPTFSADKRPGKSRPAVVGLVAASIAFGAVIVVGGGYWLLSGNELAHIDQPPTEPLSTEPSESEQALDEHAPTADESPLEQVPTTQESVPPPVANQQVDSGASRVQPVAPTEAPPSESPEIVAAADAMRTEARTYFRERRYAEAASAYARATELQPAHAGSFAGLGASKLELGDARGAIAAYRRATELAPEKSGFSAALGRAYLESGNRAQAMQSYERALALDANNGAAREALERLRAE